MYKVSLSTSIFPMSSLKAALIASSFSFFSSDSSNFLVRICKRRVTDESLCFNFCVEDESFTCLVPSSSWNSASLTLPPSQGTTAPLSSCHIREKRFLGDSLVTSASSMTSSVTSVMTRSMVWNSVLLLPLSSTI